MLHFLSFNVIDLSLNTREASSKLNFVLFMYPCLLNSVYSIFLDALNAKCTDTETENWPFLMIDSYLPSVLYSEWLVVIMDVDMVTKEVE